LKGISPNFAQIDIMVFCRYQAITTAEDLDIKELKRRVWYKQKIAENVSERAKID
jgi:hypothetical protein